ncbi:2'-5' RNA ligase [Yersinia entomophaga]|uniref:RNA 2',3'-cyclic phosphodiesterase n=1 Tax=Yersinia entomophaga TaxID=935293 RepID=A0ABM6BNA0_YERET|nr:MULTISPECIES: RNA 2',3'-cyclic phosphodiesterase [Yersinia]ANI30978.1 2'-5' RNA ligase [Yersinia entomophaga]OWF88629.1 2'-5' RNA ligase [Yersinia entomophaga]
MTDLANNPSRRLFFALALPRSRQQHIIQWRADHFPEETGRPIAAANLHLTLAFLGEVSEQKSQALRQLAGRIEQPAFTVTLDDLGHWPGSGVVWLGCKQAPRGLLQLAELLRSQAARSGCYQNPMPFHPHVTLFRHATRPVNLPPKVDAGQFTPSQFSLYESVYSRGRTRYKVIQSWPLGEKKRKQDAI